MNGLLWALPGLPALVGGGLLVAGRRGDRVAAAVAMTTVAGAVGLAAWAAVTRPAVEAAWLVGIPATLAVDGLSAVMVLTVTGVALPIVVYAAADLRPQEARARFFGFLLLFVAGMLVTVTAASLGLLLVGWEVMAVTSYALIGFWWDDPARPPAANRAYLFTRTGDLGLFLAAGAAMAGAGTLELAALPGQLDGAWLHVATAGLIVTAAAKSAQLPFSIWLSSAMQGPTPIGALLHAATMVAAGEYLVLRTLPVLDGTGWGLPTVAWLGATTAVVLGLVAVAQRDLKQVLAASTAAQKGLIFLAAGVGTVPGGAAYLVAHAAFKSLTFLGAAIYLHHAGTVDLRALPGRTRGPLLAATVLFAVGALTLAGLPPLAAWVAKDEILAAALDLSPALYAAGLVASLVTALYAGKMLFMVLRPGPAEEPAPGTRPAVQETAVVPERLELTPRRPPTALVGSMGILAVATVAIAAVGVPAVRSWWVDLVGGPAGPAPTPWELALSGMISVAGVAVAYHWSRTGRLEPWRPPGVPAPMVRWLGRWLDLDRAATGTAAGVLALSRRLARVDDAVIDAGVLAAGRFGRRLSRAVRRFDVDIVDAGVARTTAAGRRLGAGSRRSDEAVVDRAVESLAVGVGALGRLARRPQGGLLHRYYAQAVVGLGLLAVLLLVVRTP